MTIFLVGIGYFKGPLSTDKPFYEIENERGNRIGFHILSDAALKVDGILGYLFLQEDLTEISKDGKVGSRVDLSSLTLIENRKVEVLPI